MHVLAENVDKTFGFGNYGGYSRTDIRVRFTFPRFAASLVWYVWCSAVVNANSVNFETVENGFEFIRHYCHRRAEVM